MNNVLSELPQLASGAGICGAGDAVTGPLRVAVAVAVALFIAAQSNR